MPEWTKENGEPKDDTNSEHIEAKRTFVRALREFLQVYNPFRESIPLNRHGQISIKDTESKTEIKSFLCVYATPTGFIGVGENRGQAFTYQDLLSATEELSRELADDVEIKVTSEPSQNKFEYEVTLKKK